MASDQTQLKKIVIENSQANTWGEAKKEWDLLTIFAEESHCICNHSIMDNCEIKNKHNGNTLIVGNVCINHFEEDHLKVDARCFTQLKKIGEEPAKTVGLELLDFARDHQILEESADKLYRSITWGRRARTRTNLNKKRTLSAAQSTVVKRLNRLLVLGCSKERPKCPTHNCYLRPKENRKTNELFWGCPRFKDGCKNTRPVTNN